jgi:hypothetical protein
LLPGDTKRLITCDSHAPDLAGLLEGVPTTPGYAAFCEDIRLQVDLYALLMGPGQINLNLKLECFGSNLCERFHTDWVGLRLICRMRGRERSG